MLNTKGNETAIKAITQKRLLGELRLLKKDPIELLDTYPDENNPLIWYFLLRGPAETEYVGGFFIGKVLHNPEYPFKAPDFMMLTPNGRFEIEKKICLTNSSYHSENWSAMWTMKNMLLAMISFFGDDSTTGISHIKRSAPERQQYAKNSINYNMKYHYDKWIKFERFVDPETGEARSHEEIRLLSTIYEKPVTSNLSPKKPEPKSNKQVEKSTEKISNSDHKIIGNDSNNKQIEKNVQKVNNLDIKKDNTLPEVKVKPLSIPVNQNPVNIVKRPRGRPKGSKTKTKN